MYAVVDVEGNGQSPPDLVEIAVVPVSASLEIGDFRSWLVRPPRPITAVVTSKVHGITNDDVASEPSWASVADEVAAALAGRVLVAHNASVERSVLARHLPSYAPSEVIDTLALARRTWPELAGHGLDALIRARGIRMSTRYGQRHRAGYDAHATALIFRQLRTDNLTLLDG
ncbi:3'-5' exonuclease [Tenggerimyces flavus]|uniref:Exonuclease domain-containing protein n=1 Tax=Tenggerimyces flavus TaxID=1708749 RepID=A0ABV7YFY1_9ACTN|nr:3'-5' exonuclease [Tenggerimyces flavus]MBM7786839.1 DNA polymerase III epsilon subunit-like protein [Tenggerimyces flavus]